MLKRLLILGVVGVGASLTATDADAYIFRRVAPVRRVAARAVLPPYPVARRVTYGPVYRRAYYAPAYYAPHVHVGVGW
ncbi:hypothetical protein OAS39_03250 [Pirellulales bacterium]|nr:hypothetical protein [Pirellulales bacterium]